MLSSSELETNLSHKPRYEFGTQTMLNTNEPEARLSLNYVKVKWFCNKFAP